jgi:hypothetical protein
MKKTNTMHNGRKINKKVLFRCPKDEHHVGDSDVNGRIFIEKFFVMLQTGFTCYGIEPIGRIL